MRLNFHWRLVFIQNETETALLGFILYFFCLTGKSTKEPFAILTCNCLKIPQEVLAKAPCNYLKFISPILPHPSFKTDGSVLGQYQRCLYEKEYKTNYCDSH